MTELFNGGEMDSFTPSDGDVIESAATSGGPRFNPSFARCGISCGADTFLGSDITYAETAHWSAQTEAYIHFDLWMPQPSPVVGTLFSMFNAGGQAIRIRATKVDSITHTLDLQYLDNLAAWQSAGTVTLPVSLQTFDIHWKFDASGEMDLYVAGTRRIEFTADLSHLAGIQYARLHRLYSFTVWSQIMADTEPTIGHRLYTIPPASNGANTAWTGTYTEVDEIAYSDADFINSGTANQVETFAGTTPTLTGYVIQSVTVGARGKTDGSGPSNLQLALRSSSTDYFSSSKALDVGYGPFQNIWETNPATSADWVNSAISGLQFGVKSIT